jgi:hypothetical protein
VRVFDRLNSRIVRGGGHASSKPATPRLRNSFHFVKQGYVTELACGQG